MTQLPELSEIYIVWYRVGTDLWVADICKDRNEAHRIVCERRDTYVDVVPLKYSRT